MAENETNDVTRDLVESFREANQAIARSITAAQERNMKFAQNTFQNAMEVLQSHAEGTRSLMQELEQQARRQREALQKLVPGTESNKLIENYMSFLQAPFSSYQKALEATEAATRQGLDNFQKASENFQKATRQALDNFQNISRQAQNSAHKPEE
jgi:hypothetical protein